MNYGPEYDYCEYEGDTDAPVKLCEREEIAVTEHRCEMACGGIRVGEVHSVEVWEEDGEIRTYRLHSDVDACIASRAELMRAQAEFALTQNYDPHGVFA